ncbi:MAG: PLDc_N domain-containing protein [Nocardioidaceae bacterium]|nr:PLDc_N domain-containing protein [Nocardioidaceae bacterium]
MLKALTVVAAVGLSVYCLFDIASTDARTVRTLPKPLWFAVVLIPVLGPIAWFLGGRAPRRRPPPRRPQPRVTGPDDDPDFLWRIEERERRNKRGRPEKDPE